VEPIAGVVGSLVGSPLRYSSVDKLSGSTREAGASTRRVDAMICDLKQREHRERFGDVIFAGGFARSSSSPARDLVSLKLI